MTDIYYSPHRIQVTAQGNNQTLDVRYYFMPLYGPQEWFTFEPVTQLQPSDGEQRK